MDPAGAVDPDVLLDKINKCFEAVVEIDMRNMRCSIDTVSSKGDVSEEALELVVRDIVGSQVSLSRTRHAEQDAAILRLMGMHGLLKPLGRDSSRDVYVEFGAGMLYCSNYVMSVLWCYHHREGILGVRCPAVLSHGTHSGFPGWVG